MKWFPTLLNIAIVYWDPPTRSGYGDSVFGPGVEIIGRWEDRRTMRIAGSFIWSTHLMEEGGYLIRGTIAEIGASWVDSSRKIIRVQYMDSIVVYEPFGYRLALVK